ncbi:putative glutamate carboxypeptidase [Colletotrichum sp. SAR 10_99]|nr:putative glutamate carboxypeptidase [Colletotrichum sp. SAR 10_96]KAJ5011938.1 putative glutamate carboxypeptidase [Colletotrichum sp. SAR 10_99]
MRRNLLAAGAVLTGVYACQRDWAALHKRINDHKHHDHGHKKRDLAVEYPPSLTEHESILVNSFDSKALDDWSYYYTHGDHLGGHNRTMAEWTQEQWTNAGWDAHIEEYWIWYTAPLETTLKLNRPDGSVHEVSLIEDMLEEDSTTSYPNRIPAYHAMSGSGNISAEYVYVGRGQRADFEALKDQGIELEGKIALSMYGAIYRGTKVKNAQDNGMIGAVLFTDPLDDGEITVANGYAAYPALDGNGLSAEQVNRSSWVGALPDITYSSGPTTGATLDMVHFMNQTVAPTWDVIGVINGTKEDDVLIIGNHRDAWVIGGAADPNSGSAVLIELAKAFGKLVDNGWKPRRTIILGSWDAEEFGLQGSTEWVETHLPWLVTNAVAYLNLDVAVSGPRTALSGSGEIQTLAIDMMKKVLFPEDWDVGPTLYDMWFNTTEGEIPPLGSGSDYAAFYHNGISAIDIGSDGGKTDPVYHYHGHYDSYAWMAEFGDPGFKIHRVMGQWLTLIAYHIADDVIIPWDLPNAGRVLRTYYEDLNETIAETYPDLDLDLSPIDDAIVEFETAAERIATVAKQALVFNDTVLIDVVNSKYRDFSRGFASAGGLPGRPTFHNVVSAPGLDNGYGADVFPAVQDSLSSDNEEQAREWVEKSASAVSQIENNSCFEQAR